MYYTEAEVNKAAEHRRAEKTRRQSRCGNCVAIADQLIGRSKLQALRHIKIDLVRSRIQIIDSQNRPMFRTGGATSMRDILRHRAMLGSIPSSALRSYR